MHGTQRMQGRIQPLEGGGRFQLYEEVKSHNGLTIVKGMFMEKNPFSAQNQTLRSYRVYISPTK